MDTSTELIGRLADEAVAVLGEVTPGAGSMPAGKLVELVAAVEKAGRAVDAARVAVASAVERRSNRFLGTAGLAQSYGYRTGSELLEQAAGVSGAEARRRVRLGELVCPREDAVGAPLPALYSEVFVAMSSGALGAETARTITTELEAASDRAHPAAVRIAERLLVAAATGCDDCVRGLTPKDLEGAGLSEEVLAEAALGGQGTPGVPLPADAVAARARVWRDVLDPDGVEPRADLARRNRQVTLSRAPVAGLHTLRGRLTPDVAASLFAFFDTLIARPTPTFAPTEGPDSPIDRRSHAQQCHDLLAGLVRAASAAVASGLPEAVEHETGQAEGERMPICAPVPLIVTADAAQLAKGFSGTGTLSGVEGRVPLSYLAQIACDGGLQQFLTTCGRPMKLSTPGRFFTGAQRRAAALRDGTACVMPGCSMPFAALEAHHVTPFSHGGPTTVDNCALLCWWHHHLIDAGIWEIHMIRGKPRIRIPIRGNLPLAA